MMKWIAFSTIDHNKREQWYFTDNKKILEYCIPTNVYTHYKEKRKEFLIKEEKGFDLWREEVFRWQTDPKEKELRLDIVNVKIDKTLLLKWLKGQKGDDLILLYDFHESFLHFKNLDNGKETGLQGEIIYRQIPNYKPVFVKWKTAGEWVKGISAHKEHKENIDYKTLFKI